MGENASENYNFRRHFDFKIGKNFLLEISFNNSAFTMDFYYILRKG